MKRCVKCNAEVEQLQLCEARVICEECRLEEEDERELKEEDDRAWSHLPGGGYREDDPWADKP